MRQSFAQMIQQFVSRPFATEGSGDTKPSAARPIAVVLTSTALAVGASLSVLVLSAQQMDENSARSTLDTNVQSVAPVTSVARPVSDATILQALEDQGNVSLGLATRPLQLRGSPAEVCKVAAGGTGEISNVARLGMDVGVQSLTIPRVIDEAMATHIRTHRALRACSDPDQPGATSRAVALSRQGVYQDTGWAIDAIAEFGPERAVPVIWALADLRAMTAAMSLGETQVQGGDIRAAKEGVLLASSVGALNEVADRAYQIHRMMSLNERYGTPDMPVDAWLLEDLRDRHALASPLETAKFLRAAMDTRVSPDRNGKINVVLSPEMSAANYQASLQALMKLDYTTGLQSAPLMRQSPPSYAADAFTKEVPSTAPSAEASIPARRM